MSGARGRKYQVLRCAACGAELFVLAASSLRRVPEPEADAAGGSEGIASAAPGPARRFWRWPPGWRLPLAAAGITLAVVILAFTLLLRALRPAPAAGASVLDEIRAEREAGRKALRERNFAEAGGHFRRACTLRDRHGPVLPPREGHELGQWRRQAEMLADLQAEPMARLLAGWDALRESELRKVFEDRRRDYFLFDLEVSRDAAGNLSCKTFLGPPWPRLDFSGLSLLRGLPLREPQRLIFGARWREVRREGGRGPGAWVVSFEPESGVLLTDVEVAELCLPSVDDEARAVLRKQAGWLFPLP